MGLLVVQHQDDCPLDWFGGWLADHDVDVECVRPYAGEALPSHLDAHDGIVVLGGSMGAYDDATHHWLGPVKALLRSAVARGLPTLGICLGHQLLAVACGGRVAPNPAGRVMGLVDLALTDDGCADPVLAGVRPPRRAVRWNQDIVVELPPGARLLAADAAGVTQAFGVGERAWGLQFHPEASPDLVRTWAVRTATGTSADGRPTPGEVASALADVESAEADLRRVSSTVAAAFVGHLRPRA